jgi:hypothetical protein
VPEPALVKADFGAAIRAGCGWQHTSVASDHSCSRRASASCLRSSAGYSIYEGSRFRGRTVHTILRGEFIMRDRELDDAAVGKGRYLTRRI